MAMVVRSNLMALNANRQLGMNNSQVSKSLEKLSSGFRINRAGDDASGLAISEKMKAQIKGLEQASANSQDGISLVQTAEGAMTEVHNMLNRMVELATKSSNGTISDDVDREAIQNEVNQLSAEIDRIGDSTNFNGINLLDGSLGKGGGSTGAKGAASVGIDALNGNLLSDVAATKYTSTMALGGVVAASNTGAFELTYQDEAGKTQTFKIELKPASAVGDIAYRINGGDWKASGTAAVSGATIDASSFAVITKALKETAIADTFDIGGAAGAITFTAKNAGTTQAKVIAGSNHLNSAAGNPATIGASGVTQGADQYHKLALGTGGTGMNVYDPTDATTEKNIFTVNGKKFAFVAAGTDTTKLAPDINAIAIASGPAAPNDDAAAMALKINEMFGAGTVEVAGSSGASSLALHFKPVAGKAGGAGQGLTLQVGDTNDSFNKVTVSVDDVRSAGLGIKGLDVSTQDAAGLAIDVIKKGINKVSTNRGNLGALQNRLEYAINNLDVTAENMSSANSRIRDTDMAKEMMNYTKMNVLTQSAQAMLAQANQAPQSILQLLQ